MLFTLNAFHAFHVIQYSYCAFPCYLLSKVFHDIGDEVYPGEPLLSIDETDLKLVVNEAKKSLELETVSR